jgi:hypothetical protein
MQDQTNIGWQHIYSGWISKTLIQAVDDHYKLEGVHGPKYSGNSWARKLIKLLWDTMLALWRERNNILHQRELEVLMATKHEQLEHRVTRCYDYCPFLQHKERLQWFSKPKQQLLGEETRHIESWLATVERLIRITKREQKQRPRNSIIMERFLNLPATTNTKRSTAKPNPRRYKQDIRPDWQLELCPRKSAVSGSAIRIE